MPACPFRQLLLLLWVIRSRCSGSFTVRDLDSVSRVRCHNLRFRCRGGNPRCFEAVHVSRRYFLANTAAAGAAIGALARPDIARATVHPDTELLRLGEELKVLLDEWRPVNEEAAELATSLV